MGRGIIAPSAPSDLDTFDELAAAIGDDPAFITTITALINARVPRSLYDANSLLIATTDDTPLALPMGASTILARLAAGGIVAATPAQLRTLLSLVAGTDVQAYSAVLATLAAGTRQTFSNADTTVAATDRVVAQIGTMSASRTATLPAANAVAAGWEIIVADESGTVTTTKTIVIARAGADTIDGATSETISAAYGWRRLISDGTSKWSFDKGVLRAANNLSDVASVPTALANLGLHSADGISAQTCDPRIINNLNSVSVTDRGHYTRIKGTKTGATTWVIVVGVQSGNICVSIYPNNGSAGKDARPSGSRKATTGTIACPATGFQAVTFLASVNIVDGDWMHLAADNTTATFGRAILISAGGGISYYEAASNPGPASVGTLVANTTVHYGAAA